MREIWMNVIHKRSCGLGDQGKPRGDTCDRPDDTSRPLLSSTVDVEWKELWEKNASWEKARNVPGQREET